jgi:hypothetical protein
MFKLQAQHSRRISLLQRQSIRQRRAQQDQDPQPVRMLIGNKRGGEGFAMEFTLYFS